VAQEDWVGRVILIYAIIEVGKLQDSLDLIENEVRPTEGTKTRALGIKLSVYRTMKSTPLAKKKTP